MKAEAESRDPIAEEGTEVANIPVTIGPAFLERFSEQMYSSPNKAFEELVSNSWDAGATSVYIGVPAQPSASTSVWVLDNGTSMDVEGLRGLWSVADSPKLHQQPIRGRRPIGKFGLGKLATYILASQLTYVCRATDGKIRAVTMDYDQIRQRADTGAKLQLDGTNAFDLRVREIDHAQLREMLGAVAESDEVLSLIDEGVPKPPTPPKWENEYGGEDPDDAATADTWTLALMTRLKPAGLNLQDGQIRRLLRTSLPLGSAISIVFNGEPLTSSKVDMPTVLDLAIASGLNASLADASGSPEITEFHDYVEIEGIGKVTGRVRLFEDKISGVKSDEIGESNDFFVNIRGRVINAESPEFGLRNLNHASWSRFRATVRADGLHEIIATDREGLRDSDKNQAATFRAFLRELFNKARAEYDASIRSGWPDAGKVLVEKWGAIPLAPLRRAIAEGLVDGDLPTKLVDMTGVSDRTAALREWRDVSPSDPGDVIRRVVVEERPVDSPLVRYEFGERQVVVNLRHPFSENYAHTREERAILRDTSLVELLTDFYMIDIGVDREHREQIAEYRDRTFRLVAQVRRRTGPQLEDVLLKSATLDDKGKALERAVGDALEYLGFYVERLAQSNEPDGVATAPTSRRDDTKVSYRFTFDAKSTSGEGRKSATHNLSISGLKRHQRESGADFTLVVAPDFQTDGPQGGMAALQKECKDEQHPVTPMRARDLARLLQLVYLRGPLDLDRFRQVFDQQQFRHYDPDEVSKWVDNVVAEVRAEPRLPMGLLLRALEDIGFDEPDALSAAAVSLHVRRHMDGGHPEVDEKMVLKLFEGLSVLVPRLVQVTSGGRVYLGGSPQTIRDEVLKQIGDPPSQQLLGIDASMSRRDTKPGAA